MTSASLCRVFGPGFFAPAAELGGAPAAYTLERGTRYTAQIMVRGYGRCVPGLTRPFIARASSTLREAPFFDEVFGQLQPHHQFADLGAGERQLALLGLAA